MAAQRVIRFGPDDKTVEGITIDESIERAIVANAVRLGRPLKDSEEQMIREGTAGARKNEKGILEMLCENYLNVKKDIGTIVELQDMIREIKDSEDHLNLTKHEVDIFLESLKKLEKVPPQWLGYADLFRQLNDFDNCPKVEV
ncbi:MAG: hypothetical protein ABIH23_15560 [bacterium]